MENVGKAISFVSSNWAVFLGLFSVLAALIGRVFYGLSIFQPLAEVAQRQRDRRRQDEQEQYKRRMIARHIELGNSFLDANQVEAARTDFEHALKLDPNNMDAQMGVLKSQIFQPILHSRFDPEIAEKRLQLILKENNDDKHALLFLGDVYVDNNQEIALKYYQQALSKDPSLPSAYNNIGYVYAQQGKHDESLLMYQKALELSRWNLTYMNNVGHQYLLRGRYEEAINLLEEAVSWDDHYVPPCCNLAAAYRLSGDFENAYDVDRMIPELVEDESVMSERKNGRPWVFQTHLDRGVSLYSLVQIQCYVYYSMALSCYLTDRQQEFQSYAKKAQELRVDDRTPVDELLLTHITRLEDEQEAIATKLEEFREKLYDVPLPSS